MPVSRDAFLRVRRQARAALPSPRLVSCELRVPLRGPVEVEVRGRDLVPLSSPVRLLVGGEPVGDVRFVERGAVVTGRLRRLPAGRDVVVDLGPVRVEGVVTKVTRAPWRSGLRSLVGDLRRGTFLR